MYKNKSSTGFNNICGQKIKELRLQLPEKTSQRKFADMLQIHGLDVDKNAIPVSYTHLTLPTIA